MFIAKIGVESSYLFSSVTQLQSELLSLDWNLLEGDRRDVNVSIHDILNVNSSIVYR